MGIPVKVFNLLPACYGNDKKSSFEAMTETLESIKNMGFNTVWLLPFVKPGDKTIVTRSMQTKASRISLPIPQEPQHNTFYTPKKTKEYRDTENTRVSGSLYAATFEKQDDKN
jgi:hypothetical protein